MYIWTKRQFVGEMARLIATRIQTPSRAPCSSAIRTTSARGVPSHGQPLTPEGYRDLFESVEPRVFGEASLFADVVSGGPLDLSRRDDADTLDRDPALTIVASRHPGVFAPHPLDPLAAGAATASSASTRCTPPTRTAIASGSGCTSRRGLRSRSTAPAGSTCRTTSTVDPAALAALPARIVAAPLVDLARRRVILDLPERYY